MNYDADLYLSRIRQLTSTELIKSSIMTTVLGTAGFCLCIRVARGGGPSNPVSIPALALTICAMLYAIATIRLMLALGRLNPEKTQLLTSTDQLRYLHKCLQPLMNLFTMGTKKKAYALQAEIDVNLTRKIQKEVDPFEVTFHGS